jgi:hypothetical protein
MRRIAGTLLVALALLCAAGTLFLAVVAIIEMWRTRPTADTHIVAFAGLLLSGALLALAVILFLTGRFLRQPCPDGTTTAAPQRRMRWLPLAVYLVGSVGIGLVAGLGFAVQLSALRPLMLLIYEPTFVTELLLGGVMGLSFGSEPARYAILVSVNVVYFAALFYPVYSLVVMDRKVEVVRCRRMKTLGILFGTVHLLIGLAFVTMMRA